MVNDDVSKIRELNRDCFRITKELALFHSAFNNKREHQLVLTLQEQMRQLDKRCSCALDHLEKENAASNNVS